MFYALTAFSFLCCLVGESSSWCLMFHALTTFLLFVSIQDVSASSWWVIFHVLSTFLLFLLFSLWVLLADGSCSDGLITFFCCSVGQCFYLMVHVSCPHCLFAFFAVQYVSTSSWWLMPWLTFLLFLLFRMWVLPADGLCPDWLLRFSGWVLLADGLCFMPWLPFCFSYCSVGECF